VGVGEFTIFHANDLGETGVDHARVEKAFGLASGGRILWSLNPHERQEPAHAAIIKTLLKF
jgi:hypothetical protein